ncbi:MAG TPA: hypothetical protein VLB83_01780 [Candidatus Paceibacterota bacterium]|nr:hypothetical protein [Candidatus Paceibacterota bacterium]
MRNLIIIAISVGVGALLLGAVMIFRSSSPVDTGVPETQPSSDVDAASMNLEQGLGGAIYEKAANPVEGALPEVASPVANPIEGAYKNPFE